MATVNRFEDLEIWKLSRILCQNIFELAMNSDLKNNYKLFNQIDGSSGSIMDNIAEGFERNGKSEFKQFLSIAKASCGETRSQLYRILDRKYIHQEEFESLKLQTELISKKISTLINYIAKTEFKGTKYKP